MEFRDFQSAVLTQFDLMKGHQLFVTSVEKDALWEKYLASFPEGTNPMFRERTEYDCNCCKQFIRSVGRIVAIINGKKVSLWDCMIAKEPNYQIVADALAEMVKTAPIENILLHPQGVPTGTAKTIDRLNYNTWNHFHITLPNKYIVKNADIGTKLGDARTTRDMLFRALTTIDVVSINTVLELMAQGSLYRGDEKKHLVNDFLKAKKAFDKLTTDEARDLFCWEQSIALNVGVSRIRNDVVGTLLVDIAEGMDLEAAVKAWESKMAPANYKRPTALITQAMIDKARKDMDELGMTSALHRRKATRADLSVNDILHTNGASRKIMGGDDVFGDLVATKVAEMNFNKVEEIAIEKFITDVLPTVTSMEAYFENRHAPNLVSLIAPVDPESKSMFKWPSRFSWSYKDAMADALKERVKAAGGKVEGDLCCRLGWYNHDDLDFHMDEPGRYEIEYTNKGRLSPCGGMLDVDMNAGHGTTRTPVENIFYTDKRKMREGVYTLKVHNFCKRESSNVGFEVQIEMEGVVHSIHYTQAVPSNKTVIVAKIKYSAKNGFEIIESLPSSQTSKQIWGLASQNFHPVNIMMLSPNHWEGSNVGNKHYMFFIDKCVNDDANIRGFFNENLTPELEKHRKTMEIVGSKLTVADSPDELSGLGFSSTVRNNLVVRVKGATTRTLKLIF